jgi:dipeptidyl aminopeptidase/acylaminoacyl peptidase
MNKENPQVHDVYHLNLETNELTLREKNPGNVTDWLSDYNLCIRGCLSSRSDGGFDLSLRNSEQEEFKLFHSWNHEDSANSGPLIISKDGKSIYLLDSSNSNAARLLKVDIASKKQEIIFEDPQYDVGGVIIHPDSLELQLISVTKERDYHYILDDSIKDDVRIIKEKYPEAEFFLGNRTNDDQKWVIGYIRDDGPVPYYIYDRKQKSFQFLFYHHEKLNDYTLAKLEPIAFETRDGLTIHGYISFPLGKESNNLPMVLSVHGGPWSRDTWGFDPEAQLFTNRGYVCLMVNYRGSSGYGKKFLNAGDKEWGNKMLDDLVDAVNWAIEKGYANPNKIAIYGGSYGGSAALAAATFPSSSGVFCCAVDLVGPSNIITFIKSIPEYWKPFLAMLRKRVGDPETEEEFLKSRSPLFHVDNISIPLLIAHGANDPRVKQEESEQIVQKLKEKNILHTYLLFEDEGHGFVKPENRMKFYTELEKFLATHLGGRKEI